MGFPTHGLTSLPHTGHADSNAALTLQAQCVLVNSWSLAAVGVLLPLALLAHAEWQAGRRHDAHQAEQQQAAAAGFVAGGAAGSAVGGAVAPVEAQGWQQQRLLEADAEAGPEVTAPTASGCAVHAYLSSVAVWAAGSTLQLAWLNHQMS